MLNTFYKADQSSGGILKSLETLYLLLRKAQKKAVAAINSRGDKSVCKLFCRRFIEILFDLANSSDASPSSTTDICDLLYVTCLLMDKLSSNRTLRLRALADISGAESPVVTEEGGVELMERE